MEAVALANFLRGGLLLSLPLAYHALQGAQKTRTSIDAHGMLTAQERKHQHRSETISMQAQGSKYTPQQVFCIPRFECSIENSHAHAVTDAKSKEQCAEACSWAGIDSGQKPCNIFSWNKRRPVGHRCKNSVIRSTDQSGTSATSATGWSDIAKQQFNNLKDHPDTFLWLNPIEGDVISSGGFQSSTRGCDLHFNEHEWSEVCWIKPYTRNFDFIMKPVATNAHCATLGSEPTTFATIPNADEHECAEKCADRIGCRVFAWNTATKECHISTCHGLVEDERLTSGCSSSHSNGLTEVLDIADRVGSCHMTQSSGDASMDNWKVYKLKFLHAAEVRGKVTTVKWCRGAACDINPAEQVTDLPPGEFYCKHEIIVSDLTYPLNTQNVRYFQTAPPTSNLYGNKFEHVPSYLVGSILYGHHHSGCEVSDFQSEYTFRLLYTPGVKIYLIVQDKDQNDNAVSTQLQNTLTEREWNEEPIATGDYLFAFKAFDGVPPADGATPNMITIPLKVFSKQMIAGNKEDIVITEYTGANAPIASIILGVASQTANAWIPSPVLPGILEVHGGNVTWNDPAKTLEYTLTQPGDTGWESTFFSNLLVMTEGKYIGNHIKNYVSPTSHETTNRWPGQSLVSGLLWDMNIVYKPPTKICIIVWDDTNRVCPPSVGTLTHLSDCPMTRYSGKTLHGDLYDILLRVHGWHGAFSEITRNDTVKHSTTYQANGNGFFRFHRFCQRFETGEEITIRNINSTFMGGVLSSPAEVA